MAPCPLRDQSLQNRHAKPWSSGFLQEGEEHWQPPLTYKYRLQHSFSSYPHWSMARLFFKEEGSKFSWKKQTFWKLDLNAIFTFGLKYTRQTADVELCREGIEVSHRGGALFHRVPPGGTRPVWPEVARLEMWLAKRPCHTIDGLTDWLTD